MNIGSKIAARVLLIVALILGVICIFFGIIKFVLPKTVSPKTATVEPQTSSVSETDNIGIEKKISSEVLEKENKTTFTEENSLKVIITQDLWTVEHYNSKDFTALTQSLCRDYTSISELLEYIQKEYKDFPGNIQITGRITVEKTDYEGACKALEKLI